MTNGIRTGDPREFSKGRSSKIVEGSRVRQTPEGGRTYRPKRCGKKKDEDNSPKTLNDKNQQTSSQKLKVCLRIFVVSKYHSSSTQLFECEEHNLNTCS